MKYQDLWRYFGWPVLCGLAIAIVIIFTLPKLRKPAEVAKPEQGTSSTNRQWSGVVSYADAVARASASVVNIYTKKIITSPRRPLSNNPYFNYLFKSADVGQQERMRSTLGSGVIVSEEGYLLTNLHVIQGDDAQEIVVQLQDGREGQAELIGVDVNRDLAVLRINLTDLSSIPIGNPKLARIGDVVLAIGNPLGIGQSVSQGIISALGMRGIKNKFGSYIQTDAAINQGNSGGALIDAYGNLIGINTEVILSSSQQRPNGIGLAVPIDIAMQTLQDIMEFGQAVTGWLGISANQVTQARASSLKLPFDSGLQISAIYADSPAFEAGLKPGDIIVKFNNQFVSDGRRALNTIRQSRPGDIIALEVYRHGEFVKLSATLSAQPKLPGQQ